MLKFVDDDQRYLDWVNQNPSGYVVNTQRNPNPSYLVLHLASCGFVSSHKIKNYTTGEYIKLCSVDVGELESWARTEVFGGLTSCAKCKPKPATRMPRLPTAGEEEFVDAIWYAHGDGPAESASRLAQWADAAGYGMNWDKTRDGFRPSLHHRGGHYTVFRVMLDGTATVPMSSLTQRPPFSSKARRQEFLNLLPDMPEKQANNDPTYPLHALRGADLDRFLSALDWATEQVRSLGEGQPDVVVVPARSAYDEYLSFAAYVCQPHRTFRAAERMAFYRQGRIEPEIPKIISARDDLVFSEDLVQALRSEEDLEANRVADLVEQLLKSGKRHRQESYKVFLLSPPNDEATIHLKAPIPHAGADGRPLPVAWTQNHRYANLDSILKANSTFDLGDISQ